ncbi:glycosyltransferase family 4 protein [Desulfovibrio mangrovi]|uniref:glycosyltransferase family 4 protein n=1 Tax=Desulfovibrio mangrovi TaxID=2976983 RepID=UPI0022487274|nr:glycosyltransferase family 4 protein [Desulfovibrio mangrovi]UZP67563.1 glycosyltransferase family 4 protein [Desulfovibrio mangrovi]
MKRRVLVVENGAGFGGALTSLASLAAALPADRWELHLITSYPQDHIGEHGAVRKVVVMPRQRRYGAGSSDQQALQKFLGKRAGNAAFLIDHLTTGRRYGVRIAQYIRDNGIELVHCNNGVLINDAVVLGARKAHVPCVVHSRGPEYPGRVSAWLAGLVDIFMPVSGFIADTVRAVGVPEERIVVVPEGIDAAGFMKGADAEAFRRAYAIPSGVPLVGMVGCLVGWKGHDVFLDACTRFMSRSDALAVIVGGEPAGSAGDGMLARLKSRAAALGVGERVFFTGHCTQVASAMAACDVVVHASTIPEPFGRVMLEAMAAGTAVVCTRAGGPAEVVRDRENGLLVAPADAAEMAQGVLRLLENADLRSELAAEGLKTCGEYSIQRHVDLVERVYGGLLQGR